VADGQCGAGQSCINGVCHLSCSKDGDCTANNGGDVCTSSVCRPDIRRIPECKINSGCAAGLECVDAQCRAFCMASSDCALCTDGSTVCLGGYCMTPSEANPQCLLARECNGIHCTDGACVK
jgi:hypothetical protein